MSEEQTSPEQADSEEGAVPRSIELEIEVPGTVEQVWRAIATGPGITSWYVPHTVEEVEGGAASARFGSGPEMEIPGRVAAWEPPHRIVFDGGEDVEGLAFEWLVEARDSGSCIVRLVNSGFGSGADWDGQYDAMSQGWLMFLTNLKLHLEHFQGETATVLLPHAMWDCTRDVAWKTLTSSLGLSSAPAAGERVSVDGADTPPLAGTIVETQPYRISLLLDEPSRGTAFLAAEGMGEQIGVSVWSYLYGEEGVAAAESDEPRWQEWLQRTAPAG